MIISLYQYNGEPNRWTKTLSDPTNISGTFRSSVDLSNPSILIEYHGEEDAIELPPFNYCHIPSISRYYFIREITIERSNLYTLHLEEDFIQTWKNEIKSNNAYISRIGKKTMRNPYLNDTAVPLGLGYHEVRYRLELYDSNHELIEPFDRNNIYNNTVVTFADDRKDEVRTDPMPQHLPLVSDVDKWKYNLTNRQYIISEAASDDLRDEFCNRSMFSSFTKAEEFFGTSANMIIGVVRFPLNLVDHDTKGVVYDVVKIKTTSTDIPAYIIAHNYDDIVDIGEILIAGENNDFRDYSPYTYYQIYLPYYGFVDLDAADVVGNTVGVKYAINLSTGDCNAFIYKKTSNVSSAVIVKTVPFKIGEQISLTLNNAQEVAKQNLQNGMNFALSIGQAVGSAASGNAAGVIGGITGAARAGANMITNQPQNRGGFNDVNIGQYAEQYAYIIAKQQDNYNIDDLADFKGYPYGQEKSLDYLSTYHAGYCVIDSIHLDNCSATLQEKNTLESILKSGVIF